MTVAQGQQQGYDLGKEMHPSLVCSLIKLSQIVPVNYLLVKIFHLKVKITINPSKVNVFDCFVFVVPGHIL